MANGVEEGDWLNPKSMITPGAAGALTLMITNTLGNMFGTPLAWTALAISAIFGLVVLVANAPIWLKSVYWLLNSLIIFCVAMGSNTTGMELSTGATEAATEAFASQGFFKAWAFR